MIAVIDWAASRARMVLFFIVLSVLAGITAYVTLPKEGEPDIEIPALFISVPFSGISAEDSERLLVRPMEQAMADLDGLTRMSGTAAEGYAGLALEFEFDWDKSQTLADVRDAMNNAEAGFPEGADDYSINEINFSEFPILVINLSGEVPERMLMRLADGLKTRLESNEAVLEANVSGARKEMIEVLIDPLKLEAYDVMAAELVNAVRSNNQLIAAGEVQTAQGAFAVKIPSSFGSPRDIEALPIKVNGDRVVTLGDLAQIRLAFEDRGSVARLNGEPTISIDIVKRKGYNIIDAVAELRAIVAEEQAAWPPELAQAVTVTYSGDQSIDIASMVTQLEGSVLTAIALVMIVVLASLGIRSALLVGISIPTTFLLTFAALAVLGIPISNMVMFGLILAVGMLVDGGIVVVEYADQRIAEGEGPMRAYTEAAKRMFWPIVSSTATTLCAFLPMLFWPGVAGEFMGMLPVTLIFVLSASLVVALIYTPVLGGVAGRMTRKFDRWAALLKSLPWLVRAALIPLSAWLAFAGAMQLLNPGYLIGPLSPPLQWLPGLALFLIGAALTSITLASVRREAPRKRIDVGYRRTHFGRVTAFIAGNPVMPLVAIAAIVGFVIATFGAYMANNRGVEFFVETEPEQAIVQIRALGNLSLAEKDALLGEAEARVLGLEGVASVVASTGGGGRLGGVLDVVGELQVEFLDWEERRGNPDLHGDVIFERLREAVGEIPGTETELVELEDGPGGGKPVQLRLSGDDWTALREAAGIVNAKFAATPGLVAIKDTLPPPGIDWRIDVDVEDAGRFGADVSEVGAVVQLVTSGIVLDQMRIDGIEDEVDIRVRLPQEYRVLSTLDTLKVRTEAGLVPLANFVTRAPVPKVARIDRVDQARVYEVGADVEFGLTNEAGQPITATERVEHLTEWLETERPLPPGVAWEWSGEQEDQAESETFLMQAFVGALGLMFVILLAQFNSFYSTFLVLIAVVLSTVGVLIGMMVMDQPFSIIMTGTGVVALAGIVVNNNIILIDTYQDLSRYMPKIEAIVRTAEQRLRPVLLTTITTMAGIAPMMFGVSLDFVNGGYTVDSPSAVWWKQLATAVVFGLGIATVLTLVLTPALLALRVWLAIGAYRSGAALRALSLGRESREARDRVLARAAKRAGSPEILWDDAPEPALPARALRADAAE